MKEISCVYDNINLCDRYTVLFNDGDALALSEHPSDAEGFARWIVVDEYDIDRLGQPIGFEELPSDVQDFVFNELRDQ
ncbi:MAG TPA: hypothetical protein PLP71_04620 [Syntrophomonadaceae bacterium]|nr:hypothetical protein [Syntrophomonadaceae bacterium]